MRDQGPGWIPASSIICSIGSIAARRRRQHVSGSGMGLAITRGLLAAEGGRVWGENAPAAARASRSSFPAASRPVALQES